MNGEWWEGETFSKHRLSCVQNTKRGVQTELSSFLDGKGATKTLPSKRHQETEDSQHLPAYKFFQHQLPYTTTCPRNRPRLNPKQKQEVRVRSEGQGRIGTALRLATDAANLDISLAIAQMKKLPAK